MDNVTSNVRDKTKDLQKRINSAINKLCEEEKITQNEARNLKTADPNPPTVWTSIKAHKPEKGFPGRNIVSHVGCPEEPVAKELIKILTPINANCTYNVKNSGEVTKMLKNVTLNDDDILVS